MQCGVIRSTNEKFAETFRAVSAMQAEYSAYIASEQAYLRDIWEKGGNVTYGPQPSPQPERIRQPDYFPTSDITDYENAAPDHDPLPF